VAVGLFLGGLWMNNFTWELSVWLLAPLVPLALHWVFFARSWPSPSIFYPGKVVIITGASEGIGAELAVQLAKLNARVVIAARTVEKLNETAKRCKEYLRNADDVLIVPTNVAAEDDCRALIDQTIKTFGRLDVLILNAAKSDVVPFASMTDTDAFRLIEDTMKINFMQCVYLTKFALPHIQKSKGIIVPISSVAGLIGSYGSSGYAASKHAIHGFYKCLRFELGDSIDCVVLPLPYVKTAKAHSNLRPKDSNMGMDVDECARLIIKVIPSRKEMYLLTWDTWFVYQLYKVSPRLVTALALNFLRKNFDVVG
jgi:NAD(P)-dependent dehydrogenase (short-subunit alcohol dehydrogenase family)